MDLPQTLKSLKLTVWAAPQVDALMRLSSLEDLDLEFGEKPRHVKSQERMQWVSCTIKEVFANFKSIL